MSTPVQSLNQMEAVRMGEIPAVVEPSVPTTAPAQSSIQADPLPALYYEINSLGYYRPASSDRWIPVDKDSAKKFLMQAGKSADRAKGESISEVDRCLLNVQTERYVSYAAPLSGHRAGPIKVDGSWMLVTKSPNPVQPVAGDWPVLRQLLQNMFGDEQLPYLYGWMKSAMDSFLNQRWAQAQALAMAGPPNAGKTLLVTLLKEMFGGSIAYPYQYMTGATTFNSELLKAELLVVDDEAESIDTNSRRTFAASIKQFTVVKDQHCHGKHKDALNLQPIWRIVILLNNNERRLQVLPRMEDDVADKIMLLNVTQMPMPMPTDTHLQKSQFMATLIGELPAFVDFLNQYAIPADLVDSRYGIKTYHHAELLQCLEETSPEQRLLELIDILVFSESSRGFDPVQPAPFDGSAAELTNRLLQNRDYDYQVKSLLRHGTACGAYLSNLARERETRVTSRMVRGTRVYTIQPPPQGGGVEHFSQISYKERSMEGTEAGRRSPMGGTTHQCAPPLNPGRQFLPPTPPPREEADTRALAV